MSRELTVEVLIYRPTAQRCRFCDISGAAMSLLVGVVTASPGQRCC
jgi:hypothetical protein